MEKMKTWLTSLKKWFVAHKKFVLMISLLVVGIIVARSVYLLVQQKEKQQQIDEKQRQINEIVEFWEKHCEETDQEVIKKMQSPSGATLMLSIGSDPHTIMSHSCTAVYEDSNGTIQSTHFGQPIQQYGSRIFYKEDWDICDSTMTKIETNKGTDVVILVTPNYEDVYHKTITYADSNEYGMTPYDTLNSDFTPVYATPENKEDDMIDGPMWMLALSCDDLPDDYELHYGEFVLTAEDIRNGTWSSD